MGRKEQPALPTPVEFVGTCMWCNVVEMKTSCTLLPLKSSSEQARKVDVLAIQD